MKIQVILLLQLSCSLKITNGQASIQPFKTDCKNCPTIWRHSYGSSYGDTNYNPRLQFSCSAKYPIDWEFHYDEDDQVEFQKRTYTTRRNVQDFEKVKSYEYDINVFIEYSQRIWLFPNFTCFSTENRKLLTRLVSEGNSKSFEIKAVTTPNDYVVRHNSSACGAYLQFTIGKKMPYPNSIGPCYDCPGNFTANHLDCDVPSLCNSLFPYRHKGFKCLTTFETTDNHRFGGCLLSNNDVFCYVEEGAYNHKCFVSNSLNPFVVSCRNSAGISVGAQIGFYGVHFEQQDLSQNSDVLPDRPYPYFSWTEVKTTDMIDIHPLVMQSSSVPGGNYYGQNYTVECKVSSYYCSRPIWFGVSWNEYQTDYMESTTESEVSGPGIFPHTIAYLTVPLNEIGNLKITCHGPVINSSAWINSSLILKVLPIERPQITDLSTDNPNPFISLEMNRSIECNFKGHPITQVIWELDGKPVSDEFYQVETSWESNTSVLWIPQVFGFMEGNYTCKIVTFYSTEMQSIWIQLLLGGNETSSSSSLSWIIGSVSVVIGLLLVVSLIVWRAMHIIRKQRNVIRSLTDDEIKEFKEGNPNYVSRNSGQDYANINIIQLPYDKNYEISLKQLEIDYTKVLGIGAFGMVYKGDLRPLADSHNYTFVLTKMYENIKSKSVLPVAVKMVKPHVEINYFKALLSEIKVMAFIGNHDHVVKLLGACTEDIRDRKVYIVVEFCDGGSLENYLKSPENRARFVNLVEYGRIKEIKPQVIANFHKESCSTLNLFKWTLDIAKGLQHVHDKNVIHGDLACRNVLLSHNGSAKISDFGLSRQLINCSNYIKKTQVPLPWRHMPPESLQDMNFSPKSDMWAFGVVIWEIFTMAQVPYGGSHFGLNFVNDLISGIRLNKPPNSTNEIYEFMLHCWERRPEERPRPEDVFLLLEKTINDISDQK